MIQFYLIKNMYGGHDFPSTARSSKGLPNWWPITNLLMELWGSDIYMDAIRDVLNRKIVQGYSTESTGFNHSFIEDNNDGFITIGDDYAGEDDIFLFPREKFREFIDVVDKTAKKVYSVSRYESPDLLQFTIDDDWNTRIEQVYLNTNKSFFEKDGTGRPQFRLERVKDYVYKVIQSDCTDDPENLVLGAFVEDVWIDQKILNQSVDFKNDSDDGTMHYGKTFLKEERSDRFTLGLGSENNPEHVLVFSEDAIHRLLVLTEAFIDSVHDAPLDKLPGVIFFTFDEYWNVIPVPLFRPEDKNFVDN